MAYTVNRTDGSLVATVADGTIDNTTTSLVLFGKNYAGYGEALNENYVRLLENHASSTAPENPQVGQMWFNPGDNVISVYNGTEFKPLGTADATPTQPDAAVLGETWFDTVNSQLHVYDGTQFILVGPTAASGSGTSGALIETITDTLSVTHIVIKFYVGSTSGASDVVAIISKDAAFTPASGELVPGFPTINPGMQLATSVGSEVPQFIGDATNSLKLEGLEASDFLSAIGTTSTTGTLSVLNDTGLFVGQGNDAHLYVIGDEVRLSNTNLDADLLFTVNSDANGLTDVITIDGITATARVETPTVGSDASEITNKDYVDTGLDLKVNIASPVMTANADMSTNKLVNVGDPVTDLTSGLQDAATKNYIINEVLGAIFTVGSYFTGPNPNGKLPGTWVQLAANTFLMASGTGYGATGGANSKTLATANMPAHSHTFNGNALGSHAHNVKMIGETSNFTGSLSVGSDGGGIFLDIDPAGGGGRNCDGDTVGASAGTPTGTISTTSAATAFDNRPQYESVEVWKRTV